MSTPVSAFGNLQVNPFVFTSLLDLKIVRSINNHTTLYLKGIVPEEQKDKNLKDIGLNTQVEINQKSESGSTLLFKGFVSNIELKVVRDTCYLEVYAVSYSYEFDVKLKSRSFQNKDMGYEDLIKKVVSDYGGDIKDEASKGKKIKKVILQYQETDWQFLKRLASRFNTGLIPDNYSDKPKLYFGVPEGSNKGKLEDFDYTVRKKIADFRSSSENFIPGINENDFIYYEVENDELLNIGDSVSFNGITLFVSESISTMVDGLLKHTHILTPKKGLSQNTFFNEQIVGLSLEGKVIEVAKDNVKVHLQIDPAQNKGEAFWFPYSTVYTAEGNSGWYCMPELNDHVRVYFPDNKEENGIAVSSVRKDSNEGGKNKLGNPDIKYFRTKAGKELMFSPSEIVITGKDNDIFIVLNDKDGILISSKKEVKIIAKQDLSIQSEDAKIIMKAKDGIEMQCNSSKIEINKSGVTIKGSEVKTN